MFIGCNSPCKVSKIYAIDWCCVRPLHGTGYEKLPTVARHSTQEGGTNQVTMSPNPQRQPQATEH